MRCSSASTKTSADIREEEYDRKYDDKNKKKASSYNFYILSTALLRRGVGSLAVPKTL